MTQPASLPLDEAVIRALQGFDQPVLTDYQLGLIVYRLIRRGRVDEFRLRLKSTEPERRHYNQALGFLLRLGVATPAPGFADRGVYAVLGRSPATPFELLCTVNPFAYVSHLSAMEYHGLTDRVPTTLFITAPPSREWHVLAHQRMERDLGEDEDGYRGSGFPRLHRQNVMTIDRRNVRVTQRKDARSYVITEQGHVRVSSLGRTFLEMVEYSDLCGGIRHVLDVYRQNAAAHLKLILNEVDRHGTAIDKVRVGYILEELCDLHDPVLEAWQATSVQRGGSRKLDPHAPYTPQYSERWCLSLNHQ